MKIVYTRHLLEKVKEKKFTIEWVNETMKYSDFTRIESGKYYAVKKLNGITLEVVYLKERYIKVITCYMI